MSISYDHAAIYALILRSKGKMMRLLGLFQQAASNLLQSRGALVEKDSRRVLLSYNCISKSKSSFGSARASFQTSRSATSRELILPFGYVAQKYPLRRKKGKIGLVRQAKCAKAQVRPRVATRRKKVSPRNRTPPMPRDRGRSLALRRRRCPKDA